jgi:hypothetical protein
MSMLSHNEPHIYFSEFLKMYSSTCDLNYVTLTVFLTIQPWDILKNQAIYSQDENKYR